MEFETRESAEQALFAMNNRNVYDKVSKRIVKDLNDKCGHVGQEKRYEIHLLNPVSGEVNFSFHLSPLKCYYVL